MYSPFVVRLGAWSESQDSTPLGSTKNVVKEENEVESILDRLLPGDDSLWLYAKKMQINKGVRPLFLFDQFEELFSYPDEEILAFQQDLAELLYTGIPLRFRRKLENHLVSNFLPEEEEERLEAPLETKILFIIRSDKLHLLNRLKDYLPRVLKQTYELQALDLEGAKAAIQLPAGLSGAFFTPPFFFTEKALGHLMNFLKEEQGQRVEGILIQMLCEYYERNLVEKTGVTQLDLPQIGDPEIVVSNYYEEKIHALPADQQSLARRLIEEGLVSGEGDMRLSLHEAFIFQEFNVSKDLLEKLVDNRLLRAEPFQRGGFTYELSHDRLVPAVTAARTQRREAEAERMRQEEALRLKKQAELDRREKEKATKQLRIVRGLLVFAVIALASAVWGLISARKNATVAKNLLTEVQEKDSLNRDEKYNRFWAEAQALQSQGAYQQAIERYEFAREFTRDTAVVGQAIASCKDAMGKVGLFEELVRDAETFVKEGDYPKAVEKYEEAAGLKVNPETLNVRLINLKAVLAEEARKARDVADAYGLYSERNANKFREKERLYRSYIAQINKLLNDL